MHEMTQSKVDSLDTILKDLEKRLPKKLSVTSLDINQNSITADVEGSGPLDISKLLINLRDIPYLTNFTVDSYTSTSSEGSSGIPTVTFKVTADFSGTDVDADLNASAEDADNAKTSEEGND